MGSNRFKFKPPLSANKHPLRLVTSSVTYSNRICYQNYIY